MASSSQPQSSNPTQLVDDGDSWKGFHAYGDSYKSPSFIKEFKLASWRTADKREFFEHCLMNLQHHDPTLLSLDIESHLFSEFQSNHFF